jgi:hypothetical protein
LLPLLLCCLLPISTLLSPWLLLLLLLICHLLLLICHLLLFTLHLLLLLVLSVFLLILDTRLYGCCCCHQHPAYRHTIPAASNPKDDVTYHSSSTRMLSDVETQQETAV